ncbi:uncharacterized protein LOC143029571 isoform X2 [Oratosquilla oratoria]|uniref:uncharacterized protein LOC143029571 isoform X2 n=1 Tax=Oratosquilla oratoria TaxID=337810 RepID=UPI003F765BD4
MPLLVAGLIAMVLAAVSSTAVADGGTNVSRSQEVPLKNVSLIHEGPVRGCVLSGGGRGEGGGLLECAGLTLSRLEAALDDAVGDKNSSSTDFLRSLLSENATNQSSSDNNREDAATIHELYLHGCEVPRLSRELLLKVPGDLETLAVVQSNLSQVDPDAFGRLAHSLTRVSFAYNYLVRFPTALANLSRLQSLDLRHNLLQEVPPASTLVTLLPRLRHLALSFNQLGKMKPADEISNLWLNLSSANVDVPGASYIKLDLDHNGLTTFPEQFGGSFLRRLVQLDLSHNSIKSIKSNVLSQMMRLQTLDLSNNLLHELSPHQFPSSLVELNLEGNPWRCDCAAMWMLEAQEEKKEESDRSSSSVRINRPMCSIPLRLQDQELSTLTGQDLCGNSAQREAKTILVGDNSGGLLSRAFSLLHLLNVTTLNYQAILVAWKVDVEFYKLSELYGLEETLSWGITIRTPSDDPREALTKVTLDHYKAKSSDWAIADFPYTEIINGLDPNTPYIICVTPLEKYYSFSRADHCLQTRTSPVLSTTISATTFPTTLAKVKDASLGVGITAIDDHMSETLQYTVQTDEVAITPGTHQIAISWNVTVRLKNDSVHRSDLAMQPVGWMITYREFGEENETEIILISRGGEALQDFNNQYVIQDLAAGTSYVICFEKMSDESVALALEDGKEDSLLPEEENEPVVPSEGNTYYPDYLPSVYDGRVQSYVTNPPVTPSAPVIPVTEKVEEIGPFVYTSTGERIPLSGIRLPSVGIASGRSHSPSNEGDKFSGFGWVGNGDHATGRSLSSNRRQTFTYESSPHDDALPGDQKYTYVARRRRRAVEEDSIMFKKGQNESSSISLCKEVMTIDGPFTSNMAIVISAVIAVMSTLFLVCCIYCCCTRSCIQSDPGPDYTSAISYIKDRSSGSRESTLSSPGNRNEVSHLWEDKTNPLYLELGSSNDSGKNTCSISLHSSSGYVTPLPDPSNDGDTKFKFGQDHRNSIDAFGCHLLPKRLQQEQENRQFQFHPGYDVPPTSSNAALGYDYPKAVAVNTIGKVTNIQIGLPPKRLSKRLRDGRLNIGKFALNKPFLQRKPSKSESNINQTGCCRKCRDQSLVNSKAQNRNRIDHRPVHSISVDEENQHSLQAHPLTSKRLSTSAPDLTKINNTVRRPDINKLFGRIKTPEKKVNKQKRDTKESASTEETGSSEKEGEHCASEVVHQIQDETNMKSRQKDMKPHARDFGNKVGEIMLTGTTVIEVSDGYVQPGPPKSAKQSTFYCNHYD